MTQYVRHFLEEAQQVTIASPIASPAGFTAIYLGGANTLGAPYYRLTVQMDASVSKYVGDRFLRFDCTTNSGLTNGRREMVGWDVVNADANRSDFEILARFATTSTSGMRLPMIGARCSGTEAAWNGYFAEIRPTPTNLVAIVKGVAGVDTDLVTGAVTVPATGTPVWLRFQGRGTTLKAKAWTGEITDEPAAFTVTVVDATYSAAGAIGWGSKTFSDTVNNFIDLSFLSVGTGTDTAPAPPKTWNDYLTLLSLQDALLCVLFEADPLGQDALGNALPARVCAATMPFVSKPMDQPYPNICYEEIFVKPPQIKRRMNDVLRGRSTMSYGDLELEDEIANDDLTSRISAWQAYNWDGRPLRLLLGHPGWRRCDFKTVFFGTIASVYRSAYGRMGVKLRGPEALFTSAVSTQLIGGAGPNANALCPTPLKAYFNAEPPLYDPAALSYQLFLPWGAVSPANGTNQYRASFLMGGIPEVRIGGASQTQAQRTITSVNAGTDTITFDSNHGALAGGTMVFDGTSPAPPAPLGTGVKYYVKTVPVANQVTLAATSAGPTIDITTTAIGATTTPRNFDYDDPTGRITLPIDPLNYRVTVDQLAGNIGLTLHATAILQLWGGPVYFDVYHGTPGLNAQLGKWTNQQWVIGDALDEISSGQGASWNFAREGGLYFVQLAIPAALATPNWTINADDIRNWKTGVYYPASTVERLGYQVNNAIEQGADLVAGITPTQRDLYGKQYSLASYTPSESGLEQPANHLLSDQPVERATPLMQAADAQTETQRLYNLRRTPRCTYIFDTDAWAFAVELGDVVNATYTRDGFLNGKNAMVVGATDDLDTFSSELEIFARVDGMWPIVTSILPFASEAYY